MYAKHSKCIFGVEEIEYLGHLLSEKGVRAIPSKIECMINWPLPSTLKSLRRFLELTGYYRKFLRGFGMITTPLTVLLKKKSLSGGTVQQRPSKNLSKLSHTHLS